MKRSANRPGSSDPAPSEDFPLRLLKHQELDRFIELGYPTCSFLHGRKFVSEASQKQRFMQFVLLHAFEEGSEIHVMTDPDKTIVGQLWLHTSRNQFNGQKELWIWDLTIAPTCQKRGLGKKLLQFAVRRAVELDCQELWLLVAEDNYAARELYRNAGLGDAARMMKLAVPAQEGSLNASTHPIGQITLRTLKEEDIGPMLDLWQKADLPYRPSGRDTPERLLAELRSTPDLFWGAFDGNQLVGSIFGTFEGRDRKGWLNRLAVHPSHRRTGIAKALMAACENALKERGVKIIAGLVLEDNEASARLLEACGYTHHPYIHYYTKRESPEI
jgi:ribosomal protein S18 acetylase RimI-like enzyme